MTEHVVAYIDWANIHQGLLSYGWKIDYKRFNMVFKKVSYGRGGLVKGNCDAELVLKAVSDFYIHKYNKVILISGDGDFTCLVEFLNKQKVFDRVIAPHHGCCSFLLKKYATKITFLNDVRHLIEKKEKAI